MPVLVVVIEDVVVCEVVFDVVVDVWDGVVVVVELLEPWPMLFLMLSHLLFG